MPSSGLFLTFSCGLGKGKGDKGDSEKGDSPLEELGWPER